MSGADQIDCTPSQSAPAKSTLLPADAFSRNNAISVFLMGSLPAVAGSATSFLLGILFIWGLISLLFGRFEFVMTRSDRLLAWTFTGFAVLVLVTGLIGENPLEALRAAWLLPFLSLWVIIPRLRASPDVDYVHFYVVGAAVGCIGALLLAHVEVFLFGAIRPEGGAGNAAVFANMSLCLAGVAGLNIIAQSRWLPLLAVVALAAGLVAVVLSLTRGTVLAAIPVLLVLYAYAPREWRPLLKRSHILVLPVAAGVLYLVWNTVALRAVNTFLELEQVLGGENSASIGERLRLWRAAWRAIVESPLWGYGVQNRMDALIPYLLEDGLTVGRFTHVHNGFLSFAIDGGIVVFVALLTILAIPVIVAARAKRDDLYRRRLFFALIVVTAYVSFGMSQIMLKHDIMDSFYIFFAIVLAASIPRSPCPKD